MKTFEKHFTVIVAVILGLIFSSGAAVHGKDLNVLNVAVYHSRIDTLDPHVQNSSETNIVYMTYERLIQRKKGTLEFEPKLATSWKISGDAKIFTFFLRKGVKFHDGTEFDAEVVKFNFDRISFLKKGFYWMLTQLDRVEVVDKYTVRFVLKENFTPFLSTIEYFPMVSPKSVLEHEEKKRDYAATWYADHGVGTGPYRFVEWQHGVKIVMEKYEDYWGGWEGNHSATVINWIIPEAGTQRMMLEKGDLDMMQNYTVDDFIALSKNPDIQTLENDSTTTMYIRMNHVAGPTKDLRVRQALSYCFDRKLYEQLAGGRIVMPDGPLAREFFGGWAPKNIIVKYDPEKAKQLLAEAGYPKGFEMSVIAQKGMPVTETIAQVWQAGLAKAGVKVNIKVMPWPTLISTLEKWAIERDPSKIENAYIQQLGPRIGDPYGILYLAYNKDAQLGGKKKVGKGRNFMLYYNPKVDELTEKAVKTTDDKERMNIYREAYQIIADDCPDIWVDKLIDRAILRKEVKNYYFDSVWTRTVPYFNVYKVAH
jgi:peptide/nickel transport system substrate-binding protein